MDIKSVKPEDVKSGAPETTEETITTDAETDAAVEAEKAKATESVYKKENERLAAEARQKAGAVQEERDRRKKAEEESKAKDEALEALAKEKKGGLSAEETDKLLDEKLSKRDFQNLLSQTTPDVDEQKLIQFHYENSIVKTGNVGEDFKKAFAIANQHLVDQAKKAQEEREENEGFVASFQSSRPTAPLGKQAYETNPSLKRAASILDRLGVPEAKKFLGK